jgi:hypothetical protein
MGALKGGRPDDLSDSIALAIEQELNALLLADGLPALSTGSEEAVRDRRRLFCAIGRGVVRHLVDRREAFEIDVDTSSNDVYRHPDLTAE